MKDMKSYILFAVLGVLAGCLVMAAMGMFHPAIAAVMAGIAVFELLFIALTAGVSKNKKAAGAFNKTQTA